MNLHQSFGSEIYLFHQASPYRNHLLCPVQQEGNEGFRAAVFSPCGAPLIASKTDPSYSTATEAIAAAKRAVDLHCTYWNLAEMCDEWQQQGVISAAEANTLDVNLEQWHDSIWQDV